MPASAPGDPRRSPRTAPRAPSANSPFAVGALRPRANTVELPPGHRAEITQERVSAQFLGKYFAQDSLDFLMWLAQYYWNDLTGLRVVLYLMGSQEVGGIVKRTQRKIATDLKLSDEAVSRAMTKARKMGLVHTVSRGRHQLQPTVTLRGGYVTVDTPVRGAAAKRTTVRIEQLSLLNELLLDDQVPEAFREMAMPDATLPPPSPRPSKEPKTSPSTQQPEE
ncbi:hypothetical protein [Streptomyces sp. NPDC057325]|uniref:hypothetical protein n=1 Tax=unclassified Streptomyces TaxID=2593676 RepID=UPI00363E31FF